MIVLNSVKYLNKVRDNLIVLCVAALFVVLVVSTYNQDSIIVNTGAIATTRVFSKDTIYGGGGW